MANKKISELTLFPSVLSTDEIPVNRSGMNGKLTVASLAGGGVSTSRTISTTSPLVGGGDLSANRTLSIPQATSSVNGYLSSANWSTFNGKQDVISHLEYNNTDLTLWNNGKGNIVSNTSFGESALRLNTSGSFNTAFGTGSLANTTTGTANTAVGHNALNASNSIAAINNTAVGTSALGGNTTGNNNTSLGYNANIGNTIGNDIIAIGVNASNAGNTGDSVIIGNSATLYTTGGSNIAIGKNALRGSIASASANSNVAIGVSSMFWATSGSNNVAVGLNSLQANTSGSSNVAIGHSCIFTNTTGSFNTCIGSSTNSGNFSNSTIIGYGAVASANNQFVVGSAGTNAGAVTTEVNSSSQVWNVIINGVARKILLA
jgi:hypothetical protein